MCNLAQDYVAAGRKSEGVKLLQETLALMKSKLPNSDPATTLCMVNLANGYRAMGRYDDALKLREQTLTLVRSRLGPDHPTTLVCMNNLANSYGDFGRFGDALRLHQETLTLRKAKLGNEHVETLKSMENVAASYVSLGRDAEALPLMEKAWAGLKSKLGPYHADTLHCLMDMAWLLATAADVQVRDPARSLALAQEAVQHTTKQARPWAVLGVAYYRSGQWQSAITALNTAEELRPSRSAALAGFFLAMSHWQAGDHKAARRWFQQTKDSLEKLPAPNIEENHIVAEAAALIGIKTKME
jgi:tetratricopeptide (TPR) repeat protein